MTVFKITFGLLSLIAAVSQAQISLPDATSQTALITAPVSVSTGPFDASHISELSYFNQTSFNKLRAFNTAQSIQPDVGVNTRGVKDAALFKSLSPSVVMIVSEDGSGTGSLIDNNGLILTNLHVVGKSKEVGVVFKPVGLTQQPTKSDLVVGTVVRVDEVADLALVQVKTIPPGTKPIKLGDISDVAVGLDAHAIGHPHGQYWTYTKGIVSQYRPGFEWPSGGDFAHLADVVQTQTPLNPGNSGGPLLTDEGLLIGVNSFIDPKAQGLNYAVSIEDVKNFLKRPGNRIAKPSPTVASSQSCESKVIYEGKSTDKKSDVRLIDTKCNGKGDMEYVMPADKAEPQLLRVDRNGDSKPDVLVFSYSRDYKWELSLWDDDYDGKWDMVGYHQKGELKPYKLETYAEFEKKIAANKKK
jgi:S1-C subfamily serine protease